MNYSGVSCVEWGKNCCLVWTKALLKEAVKGLDIQAKFEASELEELKMGRAPGKKFL